LERDGGGWGVRGVDISKRREDSLSACELQARDLAVEMLLGGLSIIIYCIFVLYYVYM
jgi:hypothetical protein